LLHVLTDPYRWIAMLKIGACAQGLPNDYLNYLRSLRVPLLQFFRDDLAHRH